MKAVHQETGEDLTRTTSGAAATGIGAVIRRNIRLTRQQLHRGLVNACVTGGKNLSADDA